jgi:hypothetical protein
MAALEQALNSDSEPVGPRTYSTKPVAEVVAAHIASPAREPIENPDNSIGGAALIGDRRPLPSIVPIVGAAAALIFLCLAGIVLAAFAFGRVGQSRFGLGENGSGPQVTANPENGVDGGFPQDSAGSGSDSSSGESPAPTVTLPGGGSGSSDNRLVFFYNGGGFYAWNPGGGDIIIRELAFQAVDKDGNPTGSFFEARRWAGYYPAIQVGKCDRLEILNDVPKERPGQCQGYNAIMTPEESDPMVFWLARESVNDFVVTFGGQEIGRCDVSAGQCEVVIP